MRAARPRAIAEVGNGSPGSVVCSTGPEARPPTNRARENAAKVRLVLSAKSDVCSLGNSDVVVWPSISVSAKVEGTPGVVPGRPSAERRMGVDAGAEYFRLDCAADNERLGTMYREYGFIEVGKEIPGFTAALMEFPLGCGTTVE